MWNGIVYFFDYYTPRFITEDVVCRIIERRTIDGKNFDTVTMVKPLHWVAPGEQFDYIVTARFFNFFGYPLNMKLLGQPRVFKAGEVHRIGGE